MIAGCHRPEDTRYPTFPYRPDFNDGAIINPVPLHRLFRLPTLAQIPREELDDNGA